MRRFVALSILLATTQLSWGLSVATEIVVSVPDQQLGVIDRGKVISTYPISTSKFGLGDGSGSYRTPLEVLFVSAKFGDHLPAGAVIKNRVSTGEIVNPNAPGRDAIVSRVIWLRGMEQQNRGARSLHLHSRNAGRAIAGAAGKFRLHSNALA
jgi:L,D-transpeptidase-like protein